MYAVRMIQEMSVWNGISILYLLVVSYYDIRYRKIPLRIIAVGVSMAAISMLLGHRNEIESCIGGAFIGIVLLGIGRVTKESIGYGDGAVFVITGCLLGIRQNVFLLCASLAISTMYSIMLLMCKRGKRETTFPFLPCVLICCMMLTFWGELSI